MASEKLCAICFNEWDYICCGCNMQICQNCLTIGNELGVCSEKSCVNTFYCSVSCIIKNHIHWNNNSRYAVYNLFLQSDDNGLIRFYISINIVMQERLYSSCISEKLVKELREFINVRDVCEEICNWF